MRHLLNTTDLTINEIQSLMETAMDIAAHPEKYQDALKRKKLASLFFEPSTRTRLSFEAAMIELGGQVIGFASAASSSATKGETVADTTRMVNCYADIIAMRHPAEGAPRVAAEYAKIPVINAGDGSHCHPTQTLADLLTIYKHKGKLEGLTIGVCGDLKYGRTVHSLLSAMARYPGNQYIFISPEELTLPQYLKDELSLKHVPWAEFTDLAGALYELDVLYMTRVQRERFTDEATFTRLEDDFVLNRAKLNGAKGDLCVMHPLPRVNEIAADVDDDPRACYFEQALNGKHMRMALMLKMMDSIGEAWPLPEGEPIENTRCINPKCISSQERDVKPLFTRREGKVRCLYCEGDAKSIH